MRTSIPHRTSLTIPTDLGERIHRLPAGILPEVSSPSALLRALLERGVASAEADAEVEAYNAAYPTPDTPDPAAAVARRARVGEAAEQQLHAAELQASRGRGRARA